MHAMANQMQIATPVDPAGNNLPKVNQATPGGTATSWQARPNFSYAAGKVTANFYSSTGLCYSDCTPKTQAQLCGSNSCGTVDLQTPSG
jgi:hypothetical protein